MESITVADGYLLCYRFLVSLILPGWLDSQRRLDAKWNSHRERQKVQGFILCPGASHVLYQFLRGASVCKFLTGDVPLELQRLVLLLILRLLIIYVMVLLL